MIDTKQHPVTGFNHRLLSLELEHCGVARQYLQELIQISFPNPQGDQINFNAHNLAILNRLLGQMISADDYESLQVSHQQFHQYMDALAESLELRQDNDNALGQYEYYHGFLNDLYGLEYSQRANFLLQEGIERPEDADYWDNQIEQLKTAESEKIFEERKKAVLHEMMQKSDYKVIQSLLLYRQLQKSVDNLVGLRTSYLEKNMSLSRLGKDIGWVGLGAAILGGATAFGLASTVFFLPAVLLAGGVIAYGVIDSVKALNELHQEGDNQKTGKRKLTDLPEDLKDQYDIDNLQERRHTLHMKAKRDRMLYNALGTGTSVAGLGLGILALVAIIPALAFPPGLGIAIAVLSGITLLAGAAIIGAKTWKSYNANQILKATSDKEFASEMGTYKYLDEERQIKGHQDKDILDALSQKSSKTNLSQSADIESPSEKVKPEVAALTETLNNEPNKKIGKAKPSPPPKKLTKNDNEEESERDDEGESDSSSAHI